MQGFATGLLYGNEVTLEYYQPKSITEKTIISLAYVVQGYRYIQLPEISTRSLGESGSCNVNINCTEGQNWQQEKNAVALILVNGIRYCTGSLVNTTANDNRPLFLTANHCLSGNDAIENPNLSHWSFYWQYESPNCSNISTEPPILSTVGATILANNSISDFALLRLTEDPRNKQGVQPYYLGWDNTGNSGVGGTGIHHPKGDVKKISIDRDALTNYSSSISWSGGTTSSPNTHWQSIIDIGTLEGGSSGSPILNNQHKVIGQLHGGQDGCAPVTKYYGKFNVSWTGNGATDSRRRLRDWLDPINSNIQILDGKGLFEIIGTTPVCSSGTYSINNLPAGATVAWSSGNSNLVLASQAGGTATFNRNGTANGTGIIQATITVNGNTVPIQKEVWVGAPDNQPYISGCPLYVKGKRVITCNLNALEIQGINYYNWDADGEILSGQGTSSIRVRIPDSEPDPDGQLAKYVISVYYGNSCGNNNTNASGNIIPSKPPKVSYILYPNPTNSTPTLKVREDNNALNSESLAKKTTKEEITIKTITITDIMRNVVRRQKYMPNTKETQIKVSGLGHGIYLVIVNENTPQQQTLKLAVE